MGGRPVVYRGMLDCFRQILRHEGGCSPAVRQGCRVQGVYSAVLDCFRQLLRHEGRGTHGLTGTAVAEFTGRRCTPAASLKISQLTSAVFDKFWW